MRKRMRSRFVKMMFDDPRSGIEDLADDGDRRGHVRSGQLDWRSADSEAEERGSAALLRADVGSWCGGAMGGKITSAVQAGRVIRRNRWRLALGVADAAFWDQIVVGRLWPSFIDRRTMARRALLAAAAALAPPMRISAAEPATVARGVVVLQKGCVVSG